MNNILVTYASKYGSTKEIAEAIGHKLQDFPSLSVDVMPVKDVHTLDNYDAVIFGSAVYMGKWMDSANSFIETHKKALAQHPVWLFSSGPTGQGEAKSLTKNWEFPDELAATIAYINPREIMVFHGKLNPSQLNLFEKLIIKMVKAETGDYRDWHQIIDWAERIANEVLDISRDFWVSPRPYEI